MEMPEIAACKRLGLAGTVGSRPATITFRMSFTPAGLPALSGAPYTFVTAVMTGGGLPICRRTGKALAEPLFRFSVAGPVGRLAGITKLIWVAESYRICTRTLFNVT